MQLILLIQIRAALTSPSKLVLWPYFVPGEAGSCNHWVLLVAYPHIRQVLLLNSYTMPGTDALIVEVSIFSAHFTKHKC